MKSALLLFGLVALAQDNPRVLDGSVVNSITGAGIDGAKITLMSQGKGGIGVKDSVTDAAGNFRIPGLPPGNYRVFGGKTGLTTPSTPSLHIDAAADPPPLRLKLIPPSILRGRVFGTDGKPAVKVQVALGPEYATKTVTNDEGAFVFENVQPGQVG